MYNYDVYSLTIDIGLNVTISIEKFALIKSELPVDRDNYTFSILQKE